MARSADLVAVLICPLTLQEITRMEIVSTVIAALAGIVFMGVLLRAHARGRFETPIGSRVEDVEEFDLVAHLHRQRAFSQKTWGPGGDVRGVVDHIRKELKEIEADPTDLIEWADVILLSLDGAWRAGHSPEAICAAIARKHTINEGRRWPDWRTSPVGVAIEHDRTREGE